MKKSKIEGGADPTARNFCLGQSGNQREEAHLSIAKQVMTNRPLSLAENLATVKYVPPDKYVGK